MPYNKHTHALHHTWQVDDQTAARALTLAAVKSSKGCEKSNQGGLNCKGEGDVQRIGKQMAITGLLKKTNNNKVNILCSSITTTNNSNTKATTIAVQCKNNV